MAPITPTLELCSLFSCGGRLGSSAETDYLLMHLRLGVVQWAVFVLLFITHSVKVDVPAFRLKPELQTYLSLEFTL